MLMRSHKQTHLTCVIYRERVMGKRVRETYLIISDHICPT
jgi:hypothetical protein